VLLKENRATVTKYREEMERSFFESKAAHIDKNYVLRDQLKEQACPAARMHATVQQH
jgi:hypothetical protein